MQFSKDCNESDFSKTDVLVADILPISSFLCEINRKKQWLPQSKPKM